MLGGLILFVSFFRSFVRNTFFVTHLLTIKQSPTGYQIKFENPNTSQERVLLYSMMGVLMLLFIIDNIC